MITFWKLYTKSAPFFKFPPKTKRALLNLWLHMADTVQKMHHSVFASMELQKIAFTFYLWFPNKSQLISPEIILKKRFRCNLFQVASKVLNKHGGTGQIWTGEWRFCRPLPYHLATSPYKWKLIFTNLHCFLERPTRLELATSTLARWRSTRWAKIGRASCRERV